MAEAGAASAGISCENHPTNRRAAEPHVTCYRTTLRIAKDLTLTTRHAK
jgi:hypothetical protein